MPRHKGKGKAARRQGAPKQSEPKEEDEQGQEHGSNQLVEQLPQVTPIAEVQTSSIVRSGPKRGSAACPAPTPEPRSSPAALENKASTQAPISISTQPASDLEKPNVGHVTGPLARLTFSESSPPKRPGYGTLGRPINLRANFFRITLPDGDLHHYDVTLCPSCSRPIAREVIEQFATSYKHIFKKERPVFDGKKNMYLRHSIPSLGKDKVEFVVKCNFDDREKEFKVTVKHVAVVSMKALEDALNGIGVMAYNTIQALDVAMRHLPSLSYVSVGRSFFSPPVMNSPDYIDLGSAREIWYGYHQSIRPSQLGMLLNVDVSATTFYKEQGVLDFMQELLGERALKDAQGLRDADRVKFRKEIKGLKVEPTHLGKKGRKRKVTDVTSLPASKQTFPRQEEGKQPVDTTVKDYFLMQYNYAIKFPYLPCLQFGEKSKHNYLPLELCKITAGQRCVKKLTEEQTKRMIRGTARDASAREKEIVRLVKNANYKNDEYVAGFGITVDSGMVRLTGQVLDPPQVEYKKGDSTKAINPRDGKWDMRESSFVNGVVINSWALVSFCHYQKFPEGAAKNFVDKLSRAAYGCGMRLAPSPVAVEYCNEREVERVVPGIAGQYPKLQLFIFVVMPTAKDLYPRLKSLGDQLLGIPNQVVRLPTAQKAHIQSLNNLCQKINAKVGGVNNNISRQYLPKIFDEPVIILGADVTHPSPGDDKKPSIAAVVGSLNRSASKYCTVVRVQKHRQEIIAELKDMTKELLLQFYQYTKGKKPVKIIMYRDGVSEGQFPQVLEHELIAIREACTALERDYKPGITFAVVQKRHHARFFPENKKDAHGSGNNVPPGTLVEKGVCHPSQYDFYLCSHAGLQGTSRPSHYHVLWDDNNIAPDVLHQLTYMLCHVFFRCTRAVSIPAPAYYAHLVAFRARHHLSHNDKETTDSDDSHTSTKDAQRAGLDAVIKSMAPLVKPHKKMLSEMYFV